MFRLRHAKRVTTPDRLNIEPRQGVVAPLRHFFCSFLGKSNLALMGIASGRRKALFEQIIPIFLVCYTALGPAAIAFFSIDLIL
jgi:hypothetical protein